jgi:hypothetical protein
MFNALWNGNTIANPWRLFRDIAASRAELDEMALEEGLETIFDAEGKVIAEFSGSVPAQEYERLRGQLKNLGLAALVGGATGLLTGGLLGLALRRGWLSKATRAFKRRLSRETSTTATQVDPAILEKLDDIIGYALSALQETDNDEEVAFREWLEAATTT